MKFVHIADMHFDTPFINLSNKTDLCKLRRIEQKETFRKVIEYIKQNEIPYLFISGDLYEHKYIRESTIEYINNLFKTIPNTKVFISPGNHDPYIKNSFYNNFNWNNNVHIFKSELEKIELNEVNIYGYGFDDFYLGRLNIEEITLDNKDKINILIIHGTLDGSDSIENNYNPISKKVLEQKGFDYTALGHIHKTNYNLNNNEKIIYPGSTISLGFDELGNHGMIVGEIEKNKLNLEFIKMDPKVFKEKEINISEVNSDEELIEKINSIEIEENTFYKINLVGTRNFEINMNEINKLNNNENILKIKNKTITEYNIEDISRETTLKGMFAKEILEQIKKHPLKEDFFNEVFEIGLEILDK
ncbi:MAG: DNA repair exonuclease [Clostridia bacterium]|nr:DNA repair exonuclease [Clostridia bacterium]